jgi:hypothetical protein
MDIVGKAKNLERKIARTLDAAVVELVGASASAPLEIVHAVLDRAEQEIVEGGRGRRLFPFNRITLHVVAGAREREARARMAAIVDGPPSLAERVRARLQAAGCNAPTVTVAVAYASKAGKQWESPDYHLEFAREEVPPSHVAAPAAAPRLKLTVVHGKAAQRAFVFTGGRIDIGRRSEVLDARQRVARTNHVAFDEEGPDANRSVSRRHAHVTYHESTREYRLQDDRSVHGTSILRNGRTVAVPAGSHGVRLQAGDEILLGQARIKVGIEGS